MSKPGATRPRTGRTSRRHRPAGLDRYLSGAGSALDAIDGWGAVALLAERYDVAAAVLDRAFPRSRATLADGTSVVAVPDGFAALLAELRPGTGWCWPPTARPTARATC